MKQQTLSGFEKYGKMTRGARFLAEMDQVVPWGKLCALIEPVYPKGTGTERSGPAFLDGERGLDKWKPAVIKLPSRAAAV